MIKYNNLNKAFKKRINNNIKELSIKLLKEDKNYKRFYKSFIIK